MIFFAPIEDIPAHYLDGRVIFGKNEHVREGDKHRKFAMFHDADHGRWYTSIGRVHVLPTHYLPDIE
jgi:hypothetical protein